MYLCTLGGLIRKEGFGGMRYVMSATQEHGPPFTLVTNGGHIIETGNCYKISISKSNIKGMMKHCGKGQSNLNAKLAQPFCFLRVKLHHITDELFRNSILIC